MSYHFTIDCITTKTVRVSQPSSNDRKSEISKLLEKYNLDKDDFLDTLNKLISNRLSTICQKYCFSNRHQYVCTVNINWGLNEPNAPLCEWGNATYVWILNELISPNRLEIIQGANRSSIIKYYSKILHSYIFIERFKNWRFRRRIRVPQYIKIIDIDAHKIFWGLCDNDTPKNISQKLGRNESEIDKIVERINLELVKRNRSYLLDLAEVVSFTSMQQISNEESFVDTGYDEISHEQLELRSKVNTAYSQLNWMEQFIIDSMVVEGLCAKSVLEYLKQQGISVDTRIDPANQNVQHVYYYLRKSVAKLKEYTEYNM